jgi:hypothetical protein
VKGKTNSQSKQAIVGSGYDKIGQAIPNMDNQKRDNPHAKPLPIKCHRCNQEENISDVCSLRRPMNMVECED